MRNTFYFCVILLFAASLFIGAREALAEKLQLPSTKTGDEINQGPVIKYETEEDRSGGKNPLSLEGEVVLTAKIKSVRAERVGIMNLPSRRFRIFLKEIEVLKGELPHEDSFAYTGASSSIVSFDGQKRYAMVLNTSKGGELEITEISLAAKVRRSVIRAEDLPGT